MSWWIKGTSVDEHSKAIPTHWQKNVIGQSDKDIELDYGGVYWEKILKYIIYLYARKPAFAHFVSQ